MTFWLLYIKEMDSKTRAILRGKASKINSVFQIGKDGITDSVIDAVSKALFARELVKITVLKNCEKTPKDVLAELADSTGAEAVCAIGQKIVLYRVSNKKGIKHILEIC